MNNIDFDPDKLAMAVNKLKQITAQVTEDTKPLVNGNAVPTPHYDAYLEKVSKPLKAGFQI